MISQQTRADVPREERGAELIERKLTELTIAAQVEMRRDGYALYWLNEP